ncbi:MAG TPA: hypothetical protein DCY13_16375 [Verrucomicrobiales bacterium]|nr:hypothetical protein [Verrucomicrobiales bacterium]
MKPSKASGGSGTPVPEPVAHPSDMVRRHLLAGWALLVLFLSLGVVLEALHGFKSGFYLDVSNETRRLMWRLAHAHGTFLGLVQIAFAFTLERVPHWRAGSSILAGFCIHGASVLLPLGFFLGGMVLHAGDPGMGIMLVPLGALLLFACGLLTIWALKSQAAGTVAGSGK